MYYKSAHKARGACHVAHKANLKTKEPKKGGTSIRRRWIVVVASDRRIGLTRGRRAAVEHHSEQKYHTG
jgi:hypothetical protein